MNKINYTEEWDKHIIECYMYFSNDYKFIGKFEIEKTNKFTKLQSLYIQKEFRNKNLCKIMMDDFLKLDLKKVFLMVRNDNFIIKTYEKYGFKFYSEENEYNWMIKE